MKHLISKIAFITLIAFSSCSKSEEENLPTSGTNLRVKQYSSGGNTVQFVYNVNGKLAQIITPSSTTTYSYNSQGKIIKTEKSNDPNYQYYYSNYTYNSNGYCTEIITESKSAPSGTIDKYKYVYEYNGTDQPYQSKQYYWDNATNNWSTTYNQLTSFQYDAIGNVIRVTYEDHYNLYTYDTNGNRLSYQEYYLKSGSTTQYFKQRESTYTYDNKKNPWENLYPRVVKTFRDSKNNNLDLVNKNFNELGATISNSNFSYTYEFNSEGYPTKQTGTDGSVVEFVYEKY